MLKNVIMCITASFILLLCLNVLFVLPLDYLWDWEIDYLENVFSNCKEYTWDSYSEVNERIICEWDSKTFFAANRILFLIFCFISIWAQYDNTMGDNEKEDDNLS